MSKKQTKKVKKLLLNQMKAVEEQTEKHGNMCAELGHTMAELAEAYVKLTSASKCCSYQQLHQ